MDPNALPQEAEASAVPQDDESSKIMSSLPDQNLPKAPTKGMDESAAIMARLPDQPGPAEKSVQSVQHLDPERAAKVIPISKATGKPPAYVDQNLDGFQQAQKAPAGSMFRDIEAEYPGTAKFLGDPTNAAVAQNHIQELKDTERVGQAHTAMSILLSHFWGTPEENETPFTNLLNVGLARFGSNVAGYPAYVYNEVFGEKKPDKYGFMEGDEYQQTDTLTDIAHVLKLPSTAPDWLQNNAVKKYFDAQQQMSTAQSDALQDPVVNKYIQALAHRNLALAGNEDYWKLGKALAAQTIAGLPGLIPLAAGPEIGPLVIAGIQASESNAENVKEGMEGGRAAENARFKGILNGVLMYGGTGSAITGTLKRIAQTGGEDAAKEAATGLVQHMAKSTGMVMSQGAIQSLGNDLVDKVTGKNKDAMVGAGERAVLSAVESAPFGIGIGALGGIHGTDISKVQATTAGFSKMVHQAFGKVAGESKLAKMAPAVQADHAAQVHPGNGYIPIADFDRLFQSDKKTSAESANDLGVAASHAEALATGGHVVLTPEILNELATKQPEVYKALEDHISYFKNDDGTVSPTINQLREQTAAQMAEAEKTVKPGEEQPEEETQGISGDMADKLKTVGQPSSSAALWGRNFGNMAKMAGVKAKDLFQKYNIMLFGPRGEAAGAPRDTRPSMDIRKEAYDNMTPEEQASVYLHDPITGNLNEKAFRMLPPDPEKPMVYKIEFPGGKALNDNLRYAVADDAYRHVGQALMKADPEAAKIGTGFYVRVKDAAQGEAILKQAQAAIPEKMDLDGEVLNGKGMELLGALGENTTQADEALQKAKGQTPNWPKRGELPAKMNVFQGEKGVKAQTAKAPLSDHLKTLEAQIPREQAFREAHTDKDMNIPNRTYWDNIPKKAHASAMDVKKLSELNGKYGKENVDYLFKEMGDIMRHLQKFDDFNDIDIARTGGDEFRAQSNNPKALQDFWLEMARRLQENEHVPDEKGNIQTIHGGLNIRAALGVNDANSDFNLKHAKQFEGRPTAEHPINFRRVERHVGEGAEESGLPKDARSEKRYSNVYTPDDTAGAFGRIGESLPGRQEENVKENRNPLNLLNPKKTKIYLSPKEDGETIRGLLKGLGFKVTDEKSKSNTTPSGIAQKLAQLRKSQSIDRHSDLDKIVEEGAEVPRPDANAEDLVAYLGNFQHDRVFQSPIKTETPEFKKWFGDSKVVDEKGNPQVVYHGTDKNFSTFKHSKSTQGIFWFTSDNGKIEKGEVGAQGKGKIKELYASIKNPASWDEYEKLGLGELKSRGYDGAILKNKDGSFNGFVFESNKLKDANKNIGSFDANNPNTLKQDERGETQFSNQNKDINVIFNKNADPSTAIHEGAHVFLRVFKGLALDAKTNTPEIQEMTSILHKWFGIKDWSELTKAHEEQYARGYEQYLREGKSAGLYGKERKLFQRFTDWLVKTYKHALDLNVNVTPEMKGFFDRVTASKEEIDRAALETGFKLEPIKGEAPEVTAAKEKIRGQAMETLNKQQMVEVSRKHLEELEKFKAEATKKSTEKVEAMPLFKAESDLGERIGTREAVAKLAKKVSEGKGSDDQEAAFEVANERMGENSFSSGKALAKAIHEASINDTKQALIDKETQKAMEPYQPMKDKADFRDKAIETLHHGDVVDLLALEHESLDGLLKKVQDVRKETADNNRQQAYARAAEAKRQAAAILSQKSAKDASNWRTYISQARNAAMRFSAALKDKNLKAMKNFKAQEMLNRALASEAFKIKSEAQRKFKYMDKLADRGNDLLNMAYGHVRQMDNLLVLNGIKERVPEQDGVLRVMADKMEGEKKSVDEIADATGFFRDKDGAWQQENLPQFLDRVDSNVWRLKELIAPSVLGANAKSPETMTMGELRELHQAVQAIVHMGRKNDRMFDESIKNGIVQSCAEARASIETKVGTPYVEDKKYGVKDANFAKQGAEALLNLPTKGIPMLSNILTICKYLDQGTDGPMHRLVYRIMKHGEDEEVKLHEKYGKDYQDLVDKHYSWLETEKNRFTKLPAFDEYPGRRFTKSEIVNMAANMGNNTNFQRLVDSFHLSREKLRSMVDREMTKKDWDFVQERGDFLKKMWPDIVRQKMEVNGVEPVAVEPTPIQTKFGEYPGWYHPIDYDPAKSSQAFKTDIQRAEEWKSSSPTAGYTQSGFTKTRVKRVMDRPMRLSDDVISNHVRDVIHNQAYQKPVIDVLRVLKNSDMKQALENALGVKGAKSFNDWVQYLGAPEAKQTSGYEKVARYMRTGFIFSKVAFRPIMVPRKYAADTVNVLSELGGGNSALGAAKWATACKDYYLDKKNISDFCKQDPQMAKRMSGNINFDINDITKNLSPAMKKVATFSFVAERLADNNVAPPLYWHVYQANVAEKGPQIARDMAWESVARTLGTGSKLEHVGIQRGDEFHKMLAPAYSFQSAVYNRFWAKYKDAGIQFRAGNHGGAILTVAGAMVQVGLIGGIDGLTLAFFHNAMQPNDEERKKGLIADVATAPFKMVPGVGQIASYVGDKMMGMNWADMHLTPLDTAASILAQPLIDQSNVLFRGGEENEKVAEDISKAFEMTGIYPSLLNTWIFNYLDFLNENGEATWRDLVTRRTKH